MATYKHIRSSTANKRPTTSIADGQLAINNNSTSAGLFFKDSTGATIIKIGPVHVGTTAPNATPGAGGSSGNSTGEVWLDTSLTPVGVKIWNGSAWVNGTPTGSTTVQGLLELATDVETQAGSDAARAVTPAGLQSKVSDSTSTTSSTTIASSTAVKSAYDLANAALPKSGGTVTGNLEIGTTGSLTFEGSTADGFETTLAVVDPTGDRTITLPNISGTVVTTGDTGTVTSTMLLDGTIVNADVNASAAIAGTKISPDFGSQTVQTTGVVSHALGTALAPTVTFTGDTNTGLFSPGSDQLALATGGTERLRLDSSGRLGLGTSSPAYAFDCVAGTAAVVAARFRGNSSANNNTQIRFYGANAATDQWAIGNAIATDDATQNFDIFDVVSSANRLRIDSSGRVGIGTNAPAAPLGFGATTGQKIDFYGNNGFGFGVETYEFRIATDTNSAITFKRDGYNGSESGRFDSSGRFLVGTSTYDGNAKLVCQGFVGGETSTGAFAIRYGSARPTATNQLIGVLRFESTSNTSSNHHYASIQCLTDGASSSDTDIPGRLVFSTTADGASSPTEQMRITSGGEVFVGITASTERKLSAPSIGLWGSGSNSEIGWFGNFPTPALKFNAWWDVGVDRLHFTDADYSNGVQLSQNSNAWAAFSDVRLKENIVQLEGATALIKQLKPCRFNWKQSQELDIGFIAQEVQLVIPEAVDGQESDFHEDEETGRFFGAMGVKHDKLIPALTAALQEAIAKIETLEAKVAALEAV